MLSGVGMVCNMALFLPIPSNVNQGLSYTHKTLSSEYQKILDQPGDSLYMRAMFDRDQEQDGELSFKKDDILYVDNTMFNGKRGTWRAWLVDDEGSKLRCGTIPSKSRYVFVAGKSFRFQYSKLYFDIFDEKRPIFLCVFEQIVFCHPKILPLKT